MLWAAAVIQEVYLVNAAESKPDMVSVPKRLTCNSLGHKKWNTVQFPGWLPKLGQGLLDAFCGITQCSN